MTAQLQELVAADLATSVVRVHDGAGVAVHQTDILQWILTEGRRIAKLPNLFDALCWRLVGDGIPIWRGSLHGFTLHPQTGGMGLRWWRDLAVVEEFIVSRAVEADNEFALSPIRRTVTEGIAGRFSPDGDDWQRYPLLRRLGGLGVTDYVAFPIGQFNGRFIAMTFCTLAPAGFTSRQIAVTSKIAPAFGAVVEAHLLKRVSVDLLDTYLGRAAGQRVYSGEIVRGQGVGLRAIIMATDLREFTRMSDVLPAGDIIELLDDYFECVCSAVRTEGGEVLKFIGDGVLAIFPVDDENQGVSALRAITAARSILAMLANLNQTRAWAERPMLKIGIGLHLGDVVFGNVGAQDRLDFTVIGPAVNLAFRLEGLTKQLGTSIITSAALARTVPTQFVSLGAQQVRGIDVPIEVFGLTADA
jgi:adenylate cyclase